MRKWRSLRHPHILKRKEKLGPKRFAQQQISHSWRFLSTSSSSFYLSLIIPPDIYKFGLIKYQSFASLNVTRWPRSSTSRLRDGPVKESEMRACYRAQERMTWWYHLPFTVSWWWLNRGLNCDWRNCSANKYEAKWRASCSSELANANMSFAYLNSPLCCRSVGFMCNLG